MIQNSIWGSMGSIIDKIIFYVWEHWIQLSLSTVYSYYSYVLYSLHDSMHLIACYLKVFHKY